MLGLGFEWTHRGTTHLLTCHICRPYVVNKSWAVTAVTVLLAPSISVYVKWLVLFTCFAKEETVRENSEADLQPALNRAAEGYACYPHANSRPEQMLTCFSVFVLSCLLFLHANIDRETAVVYVRFRV